jgi:hypothetical protein
MDFQWNVPSRGPQNRPNVQHGFNDLKRLYLFVGRKINFVRIKVLFCCTKLHFVGLKIHFVGLNCTLK